MMTKVRTFSELVQCSDFRGRFRYLQLQGQVGASTFGYDRYLNQRFYRSSEWRSIRHQVILRDEGCDLGVRGYEIFDKIIIHHMNPVTVGDLTDGNDDILNPEYLISVAHHTHNAIHYGDESLLPRSLTARKPGDTLLWRR